MGQSKETSQNYKNKSKTNPNTKKLFFEIPQPSIPIKNFFFCMFYKRSTENSKVWALNGETISSQQFFPFLFGDLGRRRNKKNQQRLTAVAWMNGARSAENRTNKTFRVKTFNQKMLKQFMQEIYGPRMAIADYRSVDSETALASKGTMPGFASCSALKSLEHE